MVNASDFVFGIHLHMHLLYILFQYMVYMCNVVGILVSGTHMAMLCELDVAVVCALAHMQQCCIHMPV